MKNVELAHAKAIEARDRMKAFVEMWAERGYLGSPIKSFDRNNPNNPYPKKYRVRGFYPEAKLPQLPGLEEQATYCEWSYTDHHNRYLFGLDVCTPHQRLYEFWWWKDREFFGRQVTLPYYRNRLLIITITDNDVLVRLKTARFHSQQVKRHLHKQLAIHLNGQEETELTHPNSWLLNRLLYGELMPGRDLGRISAFLKTVFECPPLFEFDELKERWYGGPYLKRSPLCI